MVLTGIRIFFYKNLQHKLFDGCKKKLKSTLPFNSSEIKWFFFSKDTGVFYFQAIIIQRRKKTK